MSMQIEAAQSATYTSMEGSYLQVASGASYAGEVGCFTWFGTQFIAWMLGRGMTVLVDPNKKRHQYRYVSKADYVAFIRNNTKGNESITENDLEKFSDLRKVAIVQNPHNGLIRKHLSPEKSDRFHAKMVNSLLHHDLTNAMKYAAKGANPDLPFWVRAHYGLSFNNYDSGLPIADMDIEATRYTPLLFAADRGMKPFCSFLSKLHATESGQGRSIQFTRKTSEPLTQTGAVFSNSMDYHNIATRRGRIRTVATVRPHLDLETTKTTFVVDTVTAKHDFSYNREDQTLHRMQSAATTVTKSYNVVNTYTNRVY